MKRSKMAIQDQALAAHWNQLLKAGYDAGTLGYPGIDERFIQRLYLQMQEASTSARPDHPQHRFTIDTTGLFSAERDLVHFRFRYAYDPGSGTLGIDKVTARLHDLSVDIPLSGNALPTSLYVYEKLKELEQLPVKQQTQELLQPWKRSL